MIINLFNEPKICAIIGDANSGKSNLIYSLIEDLKANYNFKLYTHGLKYDIGGAIDIYSIDELEKIKDGVIFIDEFISLFDLDDRTNKSKVERTLRLLYHNNNIIILAGLPENFKKFISARVSLIFYKKVTFEDFINGSSVKKNILKYHGVERGSSILDLKTNECLIYDGEHYNKIPINYLGDKDSKKNNPNILTKKVGENVGENVEKMEERSGVQTNRL